MTPDQAKRLQELVAFVMGYQRAGKTYGQFWDDFWEAGKVISEEAQADAAAPELVEAY